MMMRVALYVFAAVGIVFGGLAYSATTSAPTQLVFARIVSGAGVQAATVTAGLALKVDGSAVTQPVSFSGTVTVIGDKSDNSANSTAKLPVIAARANAAVPTWTEGNQAPLSVDLSGRQRIDNSSWLGSTAPSVGSKTSANSIPVVIASDQGAIAVTPAANSAVNVAQFGGSAVATGTGASGAGIPRVTVANDSSLLGTKTNNAAVPGATNFGVLPILATAGVQTWTEGNLVAGSSDLSGRLRTDNTSWLGSTAPTVGSKTSANSIPVVIASDQGTIAVTPLANSAINLAQTNGVAVNIGVGAASTGTLRVAVASDSSILGTKTNNNAAPGATNFGVLPVLANASAPTWSEGNLVALSTDLAGSARNDITKVGGTATVNGGLAGSLSVGGTAATNAAITQKPLLMGVEAQSGQPAAATTANQRQLVGSLDGALYVRPGGPVPWACSLDNIGTTLTQCQAAPGASLKLYVTNIVVASTTATAGLFLIRYGTGANCGTGTTSLFPSAATVVRLGYPANTLVPTNISLQTPVSAPANNAICIVCVVTNTCTVQLTGYTAP